MEFKHNFEHEINLDKTKSFWKYLDVPKFLALITKKKLFMSRLDLFEDYLEGMTDKDLADMKTFNNMPDEEKINPKLPEETRLLIPKLKKEKLQEIEKRTSDNQKIQFASCWFYGDRESVAMWNLYSTDTGIVLKIPARTLFDFVRQQVEELKHESNFLEVTYGFVEYRPISTPSV